MFLQTYKRALEVILKKPIMLWGLSLLLGVVSIIASVVTASIPFLSIAVGYLFTCGACKLYLDGLKGKEVNSKQLFFAFNRNCVKTAGAMAWQSLWTVIWSLFYCIPLVGFIVGPIVFGVKYYSYKFVPYIMTTHPEVSAFDALKISMKMTQGKKGQMFLADLVFSAGSVVLCIILGLLAMIPVLGTVFALVLVLFAIALLLFSNIFVGLYSAAFFNEEEVAQYIPAPEAEAVQ